MTFGRMLGFGPFIPATMFLTISYFVIIVNSKIEVKGIKSFGKVVTVLLWICALLAIGLGTFILCNGKTPVVNSIQSVMQGVCGECAKHAPMKK